MDEPQAVKPHLDYLPAIFQRCVAAIVGSVAPSDPKVERVDIEADALAFLEVLAELRLQDLSSSLAKLARVQRRLQPSLEDVGALLMLHDINVCELEQERARDTSKSRLVDSLSRLELSPELEPITQNAQPFFDPKNIDHAVKAIVPSSRPMPRYAPRWMPALPPDHTYMKTPLYTNRVQDLRQLREDIVKEGRLAERALQRLLGSSGSASVLELLDPEQAARLHRKAQQKTSAPPQGRTTPAEGTQLPAQSGSYITVVDRLKEGQGQEEEEKPVQGLTTAGSTQNRDMDGEPGSMPKLKLGLASKPASDSAEASMEFEDSLDSKIQHSSQPPSREQSEALTGESGQADLQTKDSLGPEEPIGTVPVKLKLPKLKIKPSAPPAEPKPKSKPLSFRISIGKRPHEGQRVPQKEDIFGKRPKVDIEQLAHRPKEAQKAHNQVPPETSQNGEGRTEKDTISSPPSPQKTSLVDSLFAAALVDFSK